AQRVRRRLSPSEPHPFPRRCARSLRLDTFRAGTPDRAGFLRQFRLSDPPDLVPRRAARNQILLASMMQPRPAHAISLCLAEILPRSRNEAADQPRAAGGLLRLAAVPAEQQALRL